MKYNTYNMKIGPEYIYDEGCNPEIPDGYEATGEFRPPRKGEWFLWPDMTHAEQTPCNHNNYHPRIILRKKA